jgi:hypothetical protein
MSPLQHFPMPFTALPRGFETNVVVPESETSNTVEFHTGVKRRDTFLGLPCCIVCGAAIMIQRSHIIPASELDTVSSP